MKLGTSFHQETINMKIMDSAILPDFELQNKLAQLVGDSCQFNLLMRGSVHGFDTKSFHKHCDYKGKTLTLIKSAEYKCVFGGYTDIVWTSGGDKKEKGNTFLFSLRSNLEFIKMPFQSGFEIRDYSNCNPWFGSGNDLVLQDNCNNPINFKNFSNIGNSFCLPEGVQSFTDASFNFLAGTQNFRVEELEVF